jgi:hypothetical protein
MKNKNIDQQILEMIVIINECIKNDKLKFLANMIVKLQEEYQEIAKLSTDGEYEVTWTHEQLLNFLTYLPKR